MKFHDDGESFGVEATRKDVELARAAKDGLEVVSEIANTLGYRSNGETATCQRCQNERVVRPFPLNQGNGIQIIRLCESCQSNICEQVTADVEPEIEEAEPEVGDA